MVISKKNKGGGRKDGEGNRITKSKKKKEKQEKRLGSSKGSRQILDNQQLNKKKSRKDNSSSNKQHKKSKKQKKGGRYVYFPDKNIIQFLPYSYPNISYNPFKIYNQTYTGNQSGGDILPQTCSNFSPNMLERQFNCQQPFWNENCT